MINKLYWCKVFVSYCYRMLNILFPIWNYALSGVATGCSSPYCKECQTRLSIHRLISYTTECLKVNILFKVTVHCVTQVAAV